MSDAGPAAGSVSGLYSPSALARLPEEVLCRLLERLALYDLLALVKAGLDPHCRAAVDDEIIERTRLLHSMWLSNFLRLYPLDDPQSGRVRKATAAMVVRRIKDLSIRVLSEIEYQFPEAEVQDAILKEAVRRLVWKCYVHGPEGGPEGVYEESFRTADPSERLPELYKDVRNLFENIRNDPQRPDGPAPMVSTLSTLIGYFPQPYYLDKVTEHGELLSSSMTDPPTM